MYSSDLVEAFAHEQQQQILDRAASGRRVRDAARRPQPVQLRPAQPVQPQRPRRSWHPLLALHAWFAAGQL